MMSIILFLENLPVGYAVVVHQEDFVLRPQPQDHPSLQPPQITVTKNGNQWSVKGTNDPNLIQQVQDELPKCLQLEATSVSLSAAP